MIINWPFQSSVSIKLFIFNFIFKDGIESHDFNYTAENIKFYIPIRLIISRVNSFSEIRKIYFISFRNDSLLLQSVGDQHYFDNLGSKQNIF